jgi:hypothetical protein
VYVPYDEEAVERLVRDYPFFEPATIPAGTYRGVDRDYHGLDVGSMHLVTSASAPEDLVYQVTRTIWENREEVVERHPAGKRDQPRAWRCATPAPTSTRARSASTGRSASGPTAGDGDDAANAALGRTDERARASRRRDPAPPAASSWRRERWRSLLALFVLAEVNYPRLSPSPAWRSSPCSGMASGLPDGCRRPALGPGALAGADWTLGAHRGAWRCSGGS